MSEDKTYALLELYKANTQLFEQLTELVQQASQQWQSESRRAVAAALAESEAEWKALLAAKDFPALLASQTGIVQHLWEKYQAAQQVTVGNSGALTGKLAETFGEWYRRVNDVGGSAVPAAGVWFGSSNPFLQFWTNLLDGTSTQGGRSGK